jgi:aspartyl-tRNA(Asn)/glutamyl-tRNA(Gln) amidotransferase subunit B
MHDEAAGKADSRIDLNRAGTPLMEIVSRPDIRSPAEAKAFLAELKLLLTYLGVSDCNMQEGSLRVDANINLHVDASVGSVATPIVEIKNMNSFRAVERALAYEAQRQYDAWRDTGRKLGDIPKQTRGWDDQAQITRAQRHKEESSDYRYFPDPDLLPVRVSPQEVEQIRGDLGELPAALRSRLQTEYSLDAYDADVLVNQGRALVTYFEAVAQGCGDAKRAGNWVQQDVQRVLNERQIGIESFTVPADRLARLLRTVAAGDLDTSRAKDVFQHMVQSGDDVAATLRHLGIERVDTDELLDLCRHLLDENPAIVADFRGGKQQAIGALIGQARKHNPNVNPARVRELLLQLMSPS